MNKLQEARKAAGLSQAEMAKLLDIPKRTIENWEAGTRKPPVYVQKLIIEKLQQMIVDAKSNSKEEAETDD